MKIKTIITAINLNTIRQFVILLAVTTLCSTVLNAQIFFDGSLETDAPPAALGGFPMVPFEVDTRPNGNNIKYPDVPLPAPYNGSLGFTPDLDHLKIPANWSTWSHGYVGSVYFTGWSVNQMTFTLPPETRAFYFYAQPDAFGFFEITAIGEAGSRSSVSSGPIPVDGRGGAKYFGFYTDGIAEIDQIVVTAQSGANGFAVGEFGIFVGNLPGVPLSNRVIYPGILLMICFIVIRFRRNI